MELTENEIIDLWVAPFELQAKQYASAINQADWVNADEVNSRLATKGFSPNQTKAFWESLSDIGTSVGYDRTLATDFALLALYTTNDTVHACVSYNANCCASAEYGVFEDQDSSTVTKSLSKKTRKGHRHTFKAALKKHFKRHFKDLADVAEILDHPLLDLLQNDDEDLDASDFIRLTVTYLKTMGKGYWHLQRNTPGDATEEPYGIRVLKPWWIFPLRDMEGQVTGYFYTNVYGPAQSGAQANPKLRADKVYLFKEDVIDFRYPAPSDPYGGGDSPLRAAFIKTALASKFNEWQSWLLNNRCRIDGVMTVQSENATEDEIDRLDRKFKEKFKGGGNGGVLTTSLKTKFEPVSYGPTDLGPLEINEQLKTSICNALHTPVALLDSDPKYSNLETSIELHARQAVAPDLCLIAKKINKYLCSLWDDGSWFAFEEVIPTDANFELQKEQAENELWQAGLGLNAITVDEFRAHLGLDPMPEDEEEDEPEQAPAPAELPEPDPDDDTDDGDEKAHLDAILKINEQVASSTLPRATAINILARALKLPQDEAKALVGYPMPAKALCGPGCGCKGHQKASQQPPAIHPPASAEHDLAAVVSQHYAKLEDAFLSQIKGKAVVDGIITKDAAPALPDDFVPIDDWSDDLAHESKPLIELGIKQTADDRQEWYQRVGASPDVFAVMPHEIDKSANSLSLKFAQSTLDTTTQQVNDALDQLRDDLKQGLIEGDGIPEITDRVQTIFKGLSDEGASLIAQSEIQRAVSEGQRIAAKASGLVSGFKLLVSSDACDICLDLDGTETDLDGSFEDSSYAGSLVPVHPNCRCTVEEVLKDDDEES